MREIFRDSQILVRTRAGETITLNVDLADTVAQLKEAIQRQVRESIEGQDLAFEGRNLLDSEILYNYGIGKHSMVVLETQIEFIDDPIPLPTEDEDAPRGSDTCRHIVLIGPDKLDRSVFDLCRCGRELEHAPLYHAAGTLVLQALLRRQQTPYPGL